jgi:hypothetical protein
VPIGADAVSPSQQSRLRAEVDDLLTNPALTDSDADARIAQLLDELIPEPAAAAAPVFSAPRPPQPLAEAEREHVPLVPPQQPLAPVVPESEPPLFASDPAIEPGGGQVPLPPSRPVRRPSPAVPTPAWEDKYGLWSPPAPPDLVVPNDIADIAPVDDDDDLFPDPPRTDDHVAPAAELYTPPAPPEPARSGPGPLRRRWNALPSWAQIAAPTALGLTLALLAGLSLGGGSPKPQVYAPLAPVSGDPLPPSKVADGPLLPVKLDPHCPPGSSDPGLAFGNDETQAWICTRLYGIDNQILDIYFSKPVVVSSIFVMAGFKYVEPNGIDHWNEHRLVTLIKWKIGGTEILQNIVPSRAGATLKVPNLATQVISMTVMNTERPPTAPGAGTLPGIFGGPDTQKVDSSWAISHIEITGRDAGGTA